MSYFPASTLMPMTVDGILNSYAPTTVLSKLGEPVLYIIRHAEVALDVKNLIRGLLNPELDAKGKEQASKLPEFFKDRPLSAIVVDDSDRVKQTALPLANSQDIELETDINLRSWDTGTELEGKPIDAHETEIEELRNHPDQAPIGGQPWGEFKNQVRESLFRWIGRSMGSPEPIALVTHGSYIQVAWETLGGEHEGDKYLDIPVEPSGVIAVYLTRNGFEPKVIQGEKPSEDE